VLLHLLVFAGSGFCYQSWSVCVPGVYGDKTGPIVVLVEKSNRASDQLSYLMLDGRYGNTKKPSVPFKCVKGAVIFKSEDGVASRLQPIAITQTDTQFVSADTQLVGQLLQRSDSIDIAAPLVVMVQGSEREPAIGSTRAKLFAAFGIRVFVYNKRGVAPSEGLYTQNFELLAHDAAAAMYHARAMLDDKVNRSGYFGVSQGGWVAPLAATRTSADFIAVGFGLVASPIEEDLDQMLLEARHQKLDHGAIQKIHQLSNLTATIVRSHFTRGLNELETFRQSTKSEPWVLNITGEYSGAMLRMPHSELARIGRALFDNVELIWNYDASSVLKSSPIPLLWIVAGDDREAPADRTLAALHTLKSTGLPINVYWFPNTDHGMYEYVLNSDGTRKMTRVTEGYFQLLVDWMRNRPLREYGTAKTLDDLNGKE